MRAGKHIFGFVLLILIAAAGGEILRAQNADAPAGRFRESVSLPTDGAVSRKLSAAEDYISEGDWDQTVEILTQISNEHGETLISVAPGRYLNVRLYCNMLLAGFPAEGLAAYRAKVDSQARQWFEQGREARDKEALQRVVRQAFASSYGDDALFLLGEWAWARGNIDQARMYWERILPVSEQAAQEERSVPGSGRREAGDSLPRDYPDTDLDRSAVRARLVLCPLFQGDFPQAERKLNSFKREDPGAEGTLAGRTGKLAEILEGLIDEAKGWEFPSASGRIHTFAFSMQRNKVLPREVDVGAPQWWAPLPEVPHDVGPPQAALPDRGPLSYHPVVFGEVVLVNDAHRIFAWNLLTGAPAWPGRPDGGEQRVESGGRLADAVIYPLVPDPSVPQPSRPVVGVPRFTMTIHEGRLYAKMGTPVTSRSPAEHRNLQSELVCLDLARGQGKLLWKHSAEDLVANESRWAFEGAPVVADGRVYVAVRGSRPQTEFRAACFDAETGRLIWNRRVCAAVSDLKDGDNLTSHLLMTLGDETLFLSTDMGAIAALNARDGTLRWVVTYPRQAADDRAVLSDHSEQGLTPCLFHRGTVFAAPNDSDDIFAIDANSGAVLWRRSLPDRIRHLLGVGEGRLIVSGDSLWGLDPETGQRAWGRAVEQPASHGYGRGLLVEDMVWWPTRTSIEIRSQRTGAPIHRQPINLRAKESTGGNLALADGFLLVAEPQRLVAFCEYGRLKERARQEISAAPGSALPYVRLAQAEQATGEFDAALRHYRRARELAGPKDRIEARPLKVVVAERVFRLLCRLGQQAVESGDYAEAARRLNDAVPAAPDAESRLQALMQLAEALTAGNRPQEAVAAWQRILDDPELSQSKLGPHAGRWMLAAEPARSRIAGLIAEHGRSVYARFDDEAQGRFDEALQAGDAAAIRRTARRFPNADSAGASLLRLARQQRRRSRTYQALQSYRLALSHSVPAALRQEALAGLAKTMEAQGYWHLAGRTWRQLAEEFPQGTITEGPSAGRDGRGWNLVEFVEEHVSAEQFRRQRLLEGTAQPGLPLHRGWERSLGQVGGAEQGLTRGTSLPCEAADDIGGLTETEVVVPEGTAPSLDSQCVLISDSELLAVSRTNGQLRWRRRLGVPVLWAAYEAYQLLLGTAQSVQAVALETGQTFWQRPLTEQRTDAGPAAPRFAVERDRIICLIPGEMVTAFDPRDGRWLWEFRPENGALGPHFTCDSGLCWVQLNGPAQTVVLNTTNGRVVEHQPVPPDPWQADPLPFSGARYALTTVRGRILCASAEGAAPWTYDGPLSHAHAEPVLFSNGSALLLAAEGRTLSRLSPQQGQRTWVRAFSRQPVPNVRAAVSLSRDQVYAVSEGILRCYSLRDGRLQWEQYLGGTQGPWQTQAAGRYVAVYRRRASADAPQRLIFCEAATGRRVQSLSLPAAEAVRIDLGPVTSLAILDDRLYGLRPYRRFAAEPRPARRSGAGR